MQLSLLFKYKESANSLCKINTPPLATHVSVFYHSTMGSRYLTSLPPTPTPFPISSTEELFCRVRVELRHSDVIKGDSK